MSVQILKSGVINASGGVNPNLLRDTIMSGTPVANSSTDWTTYFRRYNGATTNHNIVEGIDTILLDSASNLGIAFQRKATDIGLDSTKYYTLSCEAKTTKANAQLATGLSYYTTANAWVWRGGSNAKAFNDTNTWQRFTLTFKPDADTQYICYCFTVVGVASGTDTFSIRHCKMEIGEIATAWIPNEIDSIYVGNTNGFINTMVEPAQIAQESVSMTDFIEV